MRLGLYALLLLAWLLAPGHLRVAGLFHDDGVIFSLGRSLLEGGIYRDLHSPEPIQIAKYPPGVPILVALALAAGGGTEQALSLLRIAYVFFLVAGLGALLGLLRREGGAIARLAPVLVAATALSPDVLDYLRVPMSEIPYTAITLVALYSLVRVEERSESPWRQAGLLGLLCVLAVVFRTVGAVLTASVAVHLLLAGRRATAWRFGLLVLPALALVQLFVATHAQPATGYEEITVYGLPYTSIWTGSLPWLPQIVYSNAVQSLLFTLQDLLPPVVVWLVGWGKTGWAALWVLALAA
ncbi:MAG: hypothetical protein JSV80_08510, partial [Acidobacteriota bacterium]